MDQDLFTLNCTYIDGDVEKTLCRVFDTFEEAKFTANDLDAEIVSIVDKNNIEVYLFDKSTHEYPQA